MGWGELRRINPWRNLPSSPPYVLPEDASAIERFNHRHKGKPIELQLHVLPEAFIGSPEAPVWLLNLNPGFGSDDVGHDRQIHAQQLQALDLTGDPFWMLAEHNQHSGAYRWWDKKFREPIREFGRTKVRQTFFCAELYGYHSKQGRAGFRIASQQFTFDLVEEACAAGKAFIFMRAKSAWIRSVPALDAARATQVRNWRNPAISSGNIVDWELIAGMLRS
jgi:hypothetical protein